MRRGPQWPLRRQRPKRHDVQAVVDPPPLARRRARLFEDGAVGGVIRRDCGREDRVVFWGLDGRARDFDVFLDTGQRVLEAAAPLVESFLASLAGAACAPAASSARARVVVATRREEAAREGRAAAAPAAQPAATGFARAVDVALEQLDALIVAKHGAAPPAKRTKRLFGDATNVVLGF